MHLLCFLYYGTAQMQHHTCSQIFFREKGTAQWKLFYMSSYEIKLMKYVANIKSCKEGHKLTLKALLQSILKPWYLYKHINKPSLFMLTMSLVATITVKSHLMTSVFIKIS